MFTRCTYLFVQWRLCLGLLTHSYVDNIIDILIKFKVYAKQSTRYITLEQFSEDRGIFNSFLQLIKHYIRPTPKWKEHKHVVEYLTTHGILRLISGSVQM